jgi:putative CocE/NonD family hydrolase
MIGLLRGSAARRSSSSLAVLIVAAMTRIASAGDATPVAPRSEPTNAVTVQKNVMIPVRDGTKLAADIYLPADGDRPKEGKFPVILARTPYNKDGMKGDAEWFAARGYVSIMNDTRGRYASEGTWHMILDDPNDGFDVVSWIVQQPWSSGKIGTIGTSYVGGTQHALACMNPPGLAAMIPVDSVSNCGIAGIRHGGAFEMRFMNWIFTIGAPNARTALSDAKLRNSLVENGKLMRQHIWNLPIRRGTTPLRVVPEYEDWLLEVMQHGDYDSYWKQSGYSVTENVQQYADVPVYHVTGWYDSWNRQNTMNYIALSAAKKQPQKLIIGPWTHGQQQSNWAGETEFPSEAALDFNNWRLRWFDRWLKGNSNGIEEEAPVKLFVMGGGDGHKTEHGRRFHGGSWRDEREFPLARARLTPYYLQCDGGLSPKRSEAVSNWSTFRFDPENPVPTVGGNLSSTSGIADAGGFDQRTREDTTAAKGVTLPLSERNDVVMFQTPVLQEDIEVTGPVQVRLWVSSTAIDTDFTAKLVDVCPPNADYPLGFDLNIGDSIKRARYRDSLERQVFMKPGEIYPLAIDIYPTSNVFARGHRIRLDISSSNFPRFDVNPNTGEPLQQHRRMIVADNTVFHDSRRQSHILLPIIPK